MEAIREIKTKTGLVKPLSRALPAGVMANIFAGNGAAQSAYNISQTDFVALAKAMAALPVIHRKVVRDIAASQALLVTGKEARFWIGIYEGCAIE